MTRIIVNGHVNTRTQLCAVAAPNRATARSPLDARSILTMASIVDEANRSKSLANARCRIRNASTVAAASLVAVSAADTSDLRARIASACACTSASNDVSALVIASALSFASSCASTRRAESAAMAFAASSARQTAT